MQNTVLRFPQLELQLDKNQINLLVQPKFNFVTFEIAKKYDFDDIKKRYGDRITDRFRDRASLIKFTNKSYRI